MWDQLMEIQNRLKAAAGDIDNLQLGSNDDDVFQETSFNGVLTLPEPSMASLPEIDEIVTPIRRHGSMAARDQLAKFVLRENYLDKLLTLFEDLEDLEGDRESLEALGGIVKSIRGC